MFMFLNFVTAMIIFKWFAMVIGAVMVVAAVVIMIGVIHAGASGALRARRLQSLNASNFDQVTF
jgi:hypothetical protein